MKLIIIRHGQSEADLTGVHEGRADFPLTSLGESQAKQLANHLVDQYQPEIILSSPLKRAKKTAEIIQEKVGCDLIEIEDLMEWNNGVLAGLSKEEAAIKYPLPKRGRPYHIPIEQGESQLYFQFRAERALHHLLDQYKTYERVAVVSHGGMISNLISAFVKLPNNQEIAYYTGDTGVHLLEIKEDMRIVHFLNNQEHLR